MNVRKKLIISLIIACIFEGVIWNTAFYLYNGGTRLEKHKALLADGSELEYGKEYSLQAGSAIEITGIDQKVKNVHLVVDCDNESWGDKERQCAFNMTLSLRDDGHMEYYNLPEQLISPLVKSSMYLPIESFGDVQGIKLTFAEAFDRIVVKDIEVNAHIPFRFVIFRFLITFLFSYFIVWILTCDYAANMNNGNAKSKRYHVVAVLLCILILICIVYCIQCQAWECGAFRGYNDLIAAFENHRLYLEENTDSVLSNLDNPYDPMSRYASGASSYFDTAYYDGKYYIYFGAVPAILFYMPYHLITGKYLTDSQVHFIIELLIIVGSFLLVNEIRKKYYEKLALSLSILMSATLAVSSGVILMIKRAAIYYISIGTALGLVTWGLFMWYLSISKRRLCYWQGMLGSLLMALAVGSRPQFAMFSFLAFFVFGSFLNVKKNGYKNIVLLLIPYIPVAALVMGYNYLRFGSPFDFGANYNLTGYDMVHMGIHLARVRAGLWYYLMNLPVLNLEFPFLYSQKVLTDYQGYMVTESVIGGAFAIMPITWICFKPSVIKSCKSVNIVLLWTFIPALIVTAVDTVMCGILTRYQMDIRLFLLFAAIIIIIDYIRVQALSGNQELYNRGCRLASMLCVMTIGFCVLTLFSQYEEPDYSVLSYYPVMFCKMRAMFGL